MTRSVAQSDVQQRSAVVRWVIEQISGIVRRCPVDRRVKVGFAELAYHAFSHFDLEYHFDSEVLGIRWSARAFPDLLTRHMMFEGLYQEDVLECVRHLAGPGDTVYDVGGHHGLMAVVASKAVGGTGRVITFEPNPVAREFLAENLQLNRVENVRVEPIGLSDQEGRFDFYIQEGRRVSWNSSFVREMADPHGTADRVKVDVRTLDSYVRESKLPPRLVKIDTEGTELQVLLGAAETIERHRPALLIEMNPVSARRAKTPLDEIVRFLHEHAYTIRVLKKMQMGRYRYDQWEEFDQGRHCSKKLVNVACLPSQNWGR
jgi:FkbM family methyltransferase